MATIGELQAQITVDSSGFTKGIGVADIALGGFIANLASSILSKGFQMLQDGFKSSMDAAVGLEKAVVTASIVLPKFGVNADEATAAAKTLGKELRIGTGPALDNIQKLVKSGLNLPQATDLLKRFTNEAITGKDANMGLADAVGNLTDMYYMELSALGNRSGITENVSKIQEKGLSILQKEGKYLGLKISQLDEAGLAEAKYAGFINLTNQTLDSSTKFQGTYIDNQALLEQTNRELSETMGKALLPVMNDLTKAQIELSESAKPLIENLGKLVSQGWDKLKSAMEPIKGAVGEGVTEVFENLEVLATKLKPTIDIVGQLGVKFFELSKSTLQEFLTKLGAMFERIAPTVGKLVDEVTNFVNEVMERMGPILSWLMDNVLGPLASLIGDVLIFAFEGIVNILGTVLPPIFDIVIGAFDFMKGIIEKLTPVVEWLGSVFDFAFKLLKFSVESVWNFVQPILEGFRNQIEKDLSPAVNAIGQVFENVFNGIKPVVKDALNWVIDRLNEGIRAINKLIDGINSTVGEKIGAKIGNIGEIPRFATGTDFAQGGLAMVGEQGPELVNLPRGSQVKTASETASMLSNSSNITININGANDPMAIARQVQKILARENVNSMRGLNLSY
jgi:hypothetical protein